MGHRRIVKGNRNVHTVKKRLPDGHVAVYRYHRLTRQRLFQEPGTKEFDREIAATEAAAQVAPAQFVYFVQARALGLIKIGIAGDLSTRLRAMRTACPDRLVVLGVIQGGGIALERTLHQQFALHRSHGEWFRPAAELLEYIAANVATIDAAGAA